jgi:hypothetical protein
MVQSAQKPGGGCLVETGSGRQLLECQFRILVLEGLEQLAGTLDGLDQV